MEVWELIPRALRRFRLPPASLGRGISDPLVGFALGRSLLSLESSVPPLPLSGAGWSFSLCPEAGEGGGSFQSATRRVPEYVARGSARDPERAAAEAARRARGRLRRYCAANRLNRLGTLTYAGEGCFDPLELREHLSEFFRDLRTGLGGEALPYVWVPEWHKSHGLHAHFAVGRYVNYRLIRELWGRGFVHIKLLGDLPVGSGKLSEARAAAGYLAKYVGKSFTESSARILGHHRYDVAEGFQPEIFRLWGRSPEQVLAEASVILDDDPVFEWSSSTVDDWEGPPAIWAQWGR